MDHTLDSQLDDSWRDHRPYLMNIAFGVLGNAAESEDVVQEAFGRLIRNGLDGIDDVRAWLVVVVRRLCLDHLRSAKVRRESATDGVVEPERSMHDPLDRITLDDHVQLALAVVLERLSPPERTAFVLHDVFGFPFDAVAEIVGRTPVACRQLASRARRSIRAEAELPVAPVDVEARLLSERFIAACSGGDMQALLEVLDPDVVGEATLVGKGPLVRLEGRSAVAERIMQLFGPGTDTALVPLAVEDEPGVIGIRRAGVAVMKLTAEGGRVRHVHSFLLRHERT